MLVFPGVVNQNFDHMIAEYRKVKEALITHQEKYDQNSGTITKLTNELAEISDKLEELKESFESKDSGIHDTSPLVRMKTALQQIKAESCAFDLRIGVVSHSLLAARVGVSNRRRSAAHHKNKARHGKKGRGGEAKGEHPDDAYVSD